MGWGDELLVTGHIRELQQADPRKVRIVYEKPRWHAAWEGNPRIARPGEQGDFQEYRPRDGYLRPYIAAKSQDRWTWKPYRPPKGEIYFTEEEKSFGAARAGRILIEPHLKVGASPNKDWGWKRWEALVSLMRAKGLEPTQLGPKLTRRLRAAEFLETPTMRHAAAVMAHAKAAVLPEGGLHHVAAAVGTPAVVIFGGFISPAVTGYAEHRALFETDKDHPLGCGWRVKCAHCAKAMAAITPERVLGELEKLLEERAGRVAA